jgi:hypothetical protein
MMERSYIPTSPACGLWETQLADALDGLLSPADEKSFVAHMAQCPACAELFEESRRGREWLAYLEPNPEPPAQLLEKILARTGPGQPSDSDLATVGGVVALPSTWRKSGRLGRYAEPRLWMTAAMAFFSIALTLNMAGLHAGSMRWADLRPANLRGLVERRLMTASTPIIRFYEHSRLAYELQSRVREIRRGGQGESGDREQLRQQSSPSGSGVTKRDADKKDGGPETDAPQQSVNPADNNSLVTSLTYLERPAQPSGSAPAKRERSTVWIA